MAVYSVGLQQDYIQGLDNLRKMITARECEVDNTKRQFYRCDTNEEDLYEKYLKECNDKLLHCNNKLRKKNIPLNVVDSEMALVSLLNKVRELPMDSHDAQVITSLSELWECLTEAVQGLRGTMDSFEATVLKRLQVGCTSYNCKDVTIEVNKRFTEDVRSYETQIHHAITSFYKVAQSFANAIKQESFIETNFSNRMLVSCDQKAFPILRLIPDLTEKLAQVCQLSRQWIDKDETYVHDLNNRIRETRKETWKREEDLRTQKQKQDELSKSVDDSYQLFQSNKKKLARIESELHTLGETIGRYAQNKKYKSNEKKQKEGIVGFLDISITQTRKNHSLLLKRSRLVKQLKDLEESLLEVEKELTITDQEMLAKSSQKQAIAEQVSETRTSYKTFKSDLATLNEVVDQLHSEVMEFSGSLTQLEIIQTFKVSPEKVEDFYDTPATVKLAPSLKESIRRKRKLRFAQAQ